MSDQFNDGWKGYDKGTGLPRRPEGKKTVSKSKKASKPKRVKTPILARAAKHYRDVYIAAQRWLDILSARPGNDPQAPLVDEDQRMAHEIIGVQVMALEDLKNAALAFGVRKSKRARKS